MKQFAVSLLVLSLPYWFPDATPTALARVELIGQPTEVVLRPVVAVAAQPMVVVSTDAAPAGQRAWMGVSIDAVPEALAAQLEVPEGGVLILNVANDSPADKAGLQVHDVILSVDGKDLGDDVQGLTETIGSHKPGDRVNVVLLRQGQKKTIQVELGTRPEGDGMAWKFEAIPQTKVEERVRTHGKIMGKGPGGQWFIKDLGELDKLKDLGDQIRVMVPRSGSRSTQVYADGNQKTIKIQVQDDGSSININQDDNEITVTRTDKDGNETSATYENEDDLKKADPEAFELLSGTGKGAFVHLDIDALGQHGDVTVDVGEWEEKVQEGLREAHEAMLKAHEEMQKAYGDLAEQWAEKWKDFQPQGKDGRSDPGLFRYQDLPGMYVGGHLGKAKQSFKVQSDGTIEVRIRKGDSEVVRNFAGEADLAKRDPKLYEKYQSVMQADE